MSSSLAPHILRRTHAAQGPGSSHRVVCRLSRCLRARHVSENSHFSDTHTQKRTQRNLSASSFHQLWSKTVRFNTFRMLQSPPAPPPPRPLLPLPALKCLSELVHTHMHTYTQQTHNMPETILTFKLHLESEASFGEPERAFFISPKSCLFLPF